MTDFQTSKETDHDTRNFFIKLFGVVFGCAMITLIFISYSDNQEYTKAMNDISTIKSCFGLTSYKEQLNWNVNWNDHHQKEMDLLEHQAEVIHC